VHVRRLCRADGQAEWRPQWRDWQAQVFDAVMGASSYTFAETSWTQTLPDWIGSHIRALAFRGGVPAQLVPRQPQGRGHPRQLV
jgi:transposase